jgi:hypothetical protein
MIGPYTLMCVKAVVSMVLVEAEAKRAVVPVQVVAIIPTTLAGKLPADVPTQVSLSR